MAAHVLAFLDGVGMATCDVLGFSLGGMVAQQIALARPSIFRRTILVGTAPRGGQDIMHLEKPSLAKPFGDPTLRGYARLQRIFFAPTESSQAAGQAFVARLAQRTDDLDPPSGPKVSAADVSRPRAWFVVSVSRVLHAPGGSVSRVGFSICALLSLQGDCHEPNKREPAYFDQEQRVSPICR